MIFKHLEHQSFQIDYYLVKCPQGSGIFVVSVKSPRQTVQQAVQQTVQGLLPSLTPVRFVAEDGTVVKPPAGYKLPPDGQLQEAYRRMVLGRRFDTQATALTKQGRLAVYPSSRGQEACQIAGVLALESRD